MTRFPQSLSFCSFLEELREALLAGWHEAYICINRKLKNNKGAVVFKVTHRTDSGEERKHKLAKKTKKQKTKQKTTTTTTTWKNSLELRTEQGTSFQTFPDCFSPVQTIRSFPLSAPGSSRMRVTVLVL